MAAQPHSPGSGLPKTERTEWDGEHGEAAHHDAGGDPAARRAGVAAVRAVVVAVESGARAPRSRPGRGGARGRHLGGWGRSGPAAAAGGRRRGVGGEGGARVGASRRGGGRDGARAGEDRRWRASPGRGTPGAGTTGGGRPAVVVVGGGEPLVRAGGGWARTWCAARGPGAARWVGGAHRRSACAWGRLPGGAGSGLGRDRRAAGAGPPVGSLPPGFGCPGAGGGGQPPIQDTEPIRLIRGPSGAVPATSGPDRGFGAPVRAAASG